MIPYSARPLLACKAFFSILFAGRWPDDRRWLDETGTAMPAAAPAVPEPRRETQAPPSATALQMLAVMQRDGRLIDFLMEDLTPYGDTQVGAAARDVHAGCRRALLQYLTMVPVIAGAEGDRVTVEAGTDAGSVRVIGNVTGQPPFHGVLKHRGWIVERVDLPAAPTTRRAVVAPAEVEVS